MITKLRKAICKKGIIQVMLDLNISMPTVYRWLKKKKIPEFRKKQLETYLKEF